MMLRHPPGMPSPPRFKPQCTHLTMTRLYGFEFRCDSCHRPGPFGWVYRCTQDREDLIEHAVANGYPSSFDELGEVLGSKISIRERSAAARADPLSFLEELTPEKMSQYRPDQIATILRQREGVQRAIARDKLRNKNDMISHLIYTGSGGVPVPGRHSCRPWVSDADNECRYMVCPSCRPSAADRAFLSLEAIVKGEVPPTAAVGYGFHNMGERPVMDAEILKTIGCRSVSLPKSKKRLPESPSSSGVSVMELLENQIAQGQSLLASEHRDGSFEKTVAPLIPRTSSLAGQLKHSPRCENLAAFSESEDVVNQGSSVRPPWTPPPSPSPYGKQSATETHAVGLSAEKSISDGRSSNSLKTNSSVRNQVLASVSSTGALDSMSESELAPDSKEMLYSGEDEDDVESTLPSNRTEIHMACNTPMEIPSVTNELQPNHPVTPMMERENKEHRFMKLPLEVDHGVAMLEESVELGVPDVVTQA